MKLDLPRQKIPSATSMDGNAPPSGFSETGRPSPLSALGPRLELFFTSSNVENRARQGEGLEDRDEEGGEEEGEEGEWGDTEISSEEEVMNEEDVRNYILRLPLVEITKLRADESSCPICLELYQTSNAQDTDPRPPELPIQLPCAHIMGRECIRQWIGNGNCSCPMCRARLHVLPTFTPRLVVPPGTRFVYPLIRISFILIKRDINETQEPSAETLEKIHQEIESIDSERRILTFRWTQENLASTEGFGPVYVFPYMASSLQLDDTVLEVHDALRASPVVHDAGLVIHVTTLEAPRHGENQNRNGEDTISQLVTNQEERVCLDVRRLFGNERDQSEGVWVTSCEADLPAFRQWYNAPTTSNRELDPFEDEEHSFDRGYQERQATFDLWQHEQELRQEIYRDLSGAMERSGGSLQTVTDFTQATMESAQAAMETLGARPDSQNAEIDSLMTGTGVLRAEIDSLMAQIEARTIQLDRLQRRLD